MKLMYSLQRWKLYFWNRISKKNIILGGGITHPNVTIGMYSKHGEYRIFEDNSLLFSWSTLLYQKYYWTIKGPSGTMPFGIQVLYAPFSAWVNVSNLSSNFQNYGLGLSIGKEIYGVYEPVFLYQYTYRVKLPLYGNIWKNWYLTHPSSLELHSVAFVQKIYLKKYFFARISIEMSSSDILKPAIGGSILFRIMHKHFLLRTFFYMSEPNFITNDWKYHKNIWTHSMDVQIMYSKYSYVRVRYSLSQKNPFSQYKTYDSIIKNTLQLQQLYEIYWSHTIERINNAHDFSHTIRVSYIFKNKKVSHYTYVSYFFSHTMWDISSVIKMHWIYNKKSLLLKKNDMGITLRIAEKNIARIFTLYEMMSLLFCAYNKTVDSTYDIRRCFTRVSYTIGTSFKIKNVKCTLEAVFAYSQTIGFDFFYNFSIHYVL